MGQVNSQYFFNGMQGFAPLATGYPHQQLTGFEGVPFLGGSMLGIMAQPYLTNMMGGMGMFPLGMHDQNAYDRLLQMRFTQMQMQLLNQTAAVDRTNWMRVMRGMATATGTPWGMEQRQAAGAIMDVVSGAAPFLAQLAPGLLDELSGPRGSAMVMAQQMLMGGRYRLDPVTGRMGMDTASVREMSSRIFQDMVVAGGPEATRGFKAGQLGDLYQQLQLRGMIGGPAGTPQDRTLAAVHALGEYDPAQLRDAARQQGVSLPQRLSDLPAGDLDKLRLDSRVSDRMRAIDSGQVRRTLEGYTSAVAAVRDIFGDLGRPNAPMAELVQALELMTQGASGQLRPERLGEIVRMTHELSRAGGVPIGNALAMQQNFANRAAALGLDPTLGIEASQGALAFRNAFMSTGMGNHPAWGRFNIEQATQLFGNMGLAAAGSQFVNQMAVVRRINRAAPFAEGTAAAAFAQAIENQEESFLDPTTGKQVRLADLATNGAAYMRILTSAPGVTEDTVQTMLNQTQLNQELGPVELGRRLQGQVDIRPRLQAFTTARLAQILMREGATEQQALRAAQRAGQGVMSAIRGRQAGEFEDPTQRTALISRALRKALAGTVVGNRGQAFFGTAAEDVYGFVDEMIRQDPAIRGLRSFQNAVMVDSPVVTAQVQRQQLEAQFNAQLRKEMEPLGRGGLISRALGYIMDAGPGEEFDLRKFVATAVGGEETGRITGAIQKPVDELRRTQEQIREQETKLLNAKMSDAERQQARSRLQDLHKTFGGQIEAAARLEQELGISTKTGVSLQEITDTVRAFGYATAVPQSLQDIQKIKDPEERRKALAKFHRSQAGREYGEDIKYALEKVGGLAANAIEDDDLMRKLISVEIAGGESPGYLSGNLENLSELAVKRGYGSIAELLASGDKDAMDVMKRISKDLDIVRRAGKEKRGPLDPELAARTRKYETDEDALIKDIAKMMKVSHEDAWNLYANDGKRETLSGELGQRARALIREHSNLLSAWWDKRGAEGLDDMDAVPLMDEIRDAYKKKQARDLALTTPSKLFESLGTALPKMQFTSGQQDQILKLMQDPEGRLVMGDLIDKIGKGDTPGYFDPRDLRSPESFIRQLEKRAYGKSAAEKEEDDKLPEQMSMTISGRLSIDGNIGTIEAEGDASAADAGGIPAGNARSANA